MRFAQEIISCTCILQLGDRRFLNGAVTNYARGQLKAMFFELSAAVSAVAGKNYVSNSPGRIIAFNKVFGLFAKIEF
jgi:hypothetical protein